MQIRYETMRLTMHPTKLSNGRHGGSRVEPLPIPENWQVRMADQAMYHQGNQSVFVGGRLWTLLPPPALGLKRKRTEGRKREKFYIYLDVTHTHRVRRGLRERYQNEDRATKPVMHSPRDMNIKNVENDAAQYHKVSGILRQSL